MKRTEWKWLLYFFVLLAASMASIWLTDLTTEQLVFNLHVSMEISNYKQIHNIAWKDYSADSKRSGLAEEEQAGT